MKSFSQRMRKGHRGTTLIEVMLAASILVLMVLALFEGIAVSARIARENAEYLQADAYAFDLAWKRYNESYKELRKHLGLVEEHLSGDVAKDVVPMLYRPGADVVSRTRLTSLTISNPNGTICKGILISVDVEWGASGARRRRSSTSDEMLTDYTKWVSIFKSEDG